MAHRGFSFRSFTSFMLTWTFITLLISGAVLYVAPPGRIANWTRWQLMILTKEQWQAVHTLTAIVFLIGGLFHLFKFNWKPLMTYLRRKTEARRNFRNELFASLGLFTLILAGTIAQRAPFQTIMAAGETVRQSWENPVSTPPVPHMEELTVAELAKNVKMAPDKLTESLKNLGYTPAGQDESLRDLARRYEQSPVQIYSALKTENAPAAESHQPPGTEGGPKAAGGPGKGAGGFGQGAGGAGGRGQGFKSVAELAAEYGISAETAIRNLAAQGIEAKPEDRMRDVANRSGKKPYEVIEFLKGEKK